MLSSALRTLFKDALATSIFIGKETYACAYIQTYIHVVCMYVRTYVCMCLAHERTYTREVCYIKADLFRATRVRKNVHANAHTYICMLNSGYIHMHAHAHVCTYVHIHMVSLSAHERISSGMYCTCVMYVGSVYVRVLVSYVLEFPVT